MRLIMVKMRKYDQAVFAGDRRVADPFVYSAGQQQAVAGVAFITVACCSRVTSTFRVDAITHFAHLDVFSRALACHRYRNHFLVARKAWVVASGTLAATMRLRVASTTAIRWREGGP